MCCDAVQYDANDLQQQPSSQQHYAGLASMYDPRSAHHSPTYPPSVGPACAPMSYMSPAPSAGPGGYPGGGAGLVGGGSSPDGQLKRDKDAIYGSVARGMDFFLKEML